MTRLVLDLYQLIGDAGFQYQDFTDAERKCISGKVSELVDEGIDQKQAVAKAIGVCAPEKQHKSQARGADDKPMPNIPGGKYTARQNADGTWDIDRVGIFVEHTVKLQDKEIRVGEEWMNRAWSAQNKRIEGDDYMPPTHVHHHSMGKSTAPAGFFRTVGVAKADYQGQKLWTTFANLRQVPEDIYQMVRQGLLPYRSVEVHDITKPEIDSLALLDDEVPFFRMSLLTIGREIPHDAEIEVGEVKQFAASQRPMALYRAYGAGARFLIDFTKPPTEEIMKTPAQIKLEAAQKKAEEALEAKYKADKADLAKKYQEEEPPPKKEKEKEGDDKGEKMQDIALPEDAPDWAKQMAAAIAAIIKKMSSEEPVAEEAPSPTEMSAKGQKGNGEQQLTEAELNAIPQEYRAPFLKLAGRMDGMEQRGAIGGEVTKAATTLVRYGHDLTAATRKLYAIAKKDGLPGMKAYVDGVKDAGQPDPEGHWDDAQPLEAQVNPEMQQYARMGQQVLEKALRYGKEYKDFKDRGMRLSYGSKAYIDEQLRAEGVDIPEEEEKDEK